VHEGELEDRIPDSIRRMMGLSALPAGA
jgi:hypothetical protein